MRNDTQTNNRQNNEDRPLYFNVNQRNRQQRGAMGDQGNQDHKDQWNHKDHKEKIKTTKIILRS